MVNWKLIGGIAGVAALIGVGYYFLRGSTSPSRRYAIPRITKSAPSSTSTSSTIQVASSNVIPIVGGASQPTEDVNARPIGDFRCVTRNGFEVRLTRIWTDEGFGYAPVHILPGVVYRCGAANDGAQLLKDSLKLDQVVSVGDHYSRHTLDSYGFDNDGKEVVFRLPEGRYEFHGTISYGRGKAQYERTLFLDVHPSRRRFLFGGNKTEYPVASNLVSRTGGLCH